MRITTLFDELRAKDIIVFLENGKVKVDAPEQLLTDELLQTLRSKKNEIAEYLTKFGNLSNENNCTPIAHSINNETQDVREVLNQFGAKGWQVTLSENGSEIDHLAEVLTDSETNWLTQNFNEIRAVLFQSWLVKNVFNQNPDLLEQFRFEIDERIALMEVSNVKTAYLDAVLSVGWKWWLDYQPQFKTDDLRGH